MYSGKSGCIQAELLYSGKVVVMAQKWCYLGKSGFFRANAVVFGKKWLYSGRSGCNRAKVVVFEQKLFYSGKSGFFLAKVLVFGIKCCIQAKWFYSGKLFVFG